MGLLGLKDVAQKMRKMGVRGDTDVVHVNEREKELLRAHGGSGTRNPHTGLLQYDDGGSDSGGASSSGGSSGGYSGASRSSAGYSGGIGGNAPGGFSGWSSGGYGLDAEGNVTGPAGFDSPGFSTSPNNPNNNSGLDGMGYSKENARLSRLASNPGAEMVRASYEYSNQLNAQRRADMEAAMAAIRQGIIDRQSLPGFNVGNALAAMETGRLGEMRSMGLNSEADTMAGMFSGMTKHGGLLGAVESIKSMFTGEQPDRVATPRAITNDALTKGHVSPNADGSYSMTPRGYLAAMSVPAEMALGIAVPGYGLAKAATSITGLGSPMGMLTGGQFGPNTTATGLTGAFGTAATAAGIAGVPGANVASGINRAASYGASVGSVNGGMGVSSGQSSPSGDNGHDPRTMAPPLQYIAPQQVAQSPYANPYTNPYRVT